MKENITRCMSVAHSCLFLYCFWATMELLRGLFYYLYQALAVQTIFMREVHLALMMSPPSAHYS